MNYWPSKPWEAQLVSENHSGTRIQLNEPFALIGSHDACNIRIADRRIPSLAYLAFSFEDGIEVWPLSNKTFDRWGVIQAGEALKIGATRVHLNHLNRVSPETEPTAGFPELNEGSPGSVELVLRAQIAGKTLHQPLKRRVLILGDADPSNLRLTGAGLASCDHAIVTCGQHCWLINLQPQTQETSRELIEILKVGGEGIQTGQATLSLSLTESSQRTVEQAQQVTKSSTQKTNRALQPELPKPIETEHITFEVTDRLVSMNRSHWVQRPKIKASLVTFMFLAAGLAVVWLTTQYLLPLVADIEGF